MKTFEYAKDVLPSRLHTELAEAGVKVAGVNVVEPVAINDDAEHHPTGEPMTVVVLVDDDQEEAPVAAVVAAHDGTVA